MKKLRQIGNLPKDTVVPRFKPKAIFLQNPFFKDHKAYNYSHTQ